MTLACEDANSILVEVVTVDAEKPVDLLKLCLVKSLKFKFFGDGDVWLIFWS